MVQREIHISGSDGMVLPGNDYPLVSFVVCYAPFRSIELACYAEKVHLMVSGLMGFRGSWLKSSTIF